MSALKSRRGGSQHEDAEKAAKELHAAIDQPGIKLAIFYCAPDYDFERLGPALSRLFGDIPLIGCTTAGEITPGGYLGGSITGVSIASETFSAVTHRVDDLSSFETSSAEAITRSATSALIRETGQSQASFAFLLIDGLCMKEELFVSSVHRHLGSLPLFGGSAGDGTRFERTWLYHEGAFHTDCALLTLVHTSNPFHVFKTQHFVSSDDKLVVTEADPARRIVTEINGVPAGREYARMVGLEVDKLTPLIFSTYPVVVRVGGSYYVRSIQKVNEDESLTFFCAIDAGIVLTVARGIDLVENLEQAFADVREKVGPPELVIGCDCILRNLELDQRGLKERVGQIFMDNRVVGFATYGEQFNSMHVNQTFTGVAIGAPAAEH